MCGRFTLTISAQKFYKRYKVEKRTIEIRSRYNIAPGQFTPIIIDRDGDMKYEVVLGRWGLWPHWTKDEKIANRLINARGETIDEKPTFKTSFKSKRCLVPASGFYEWQKKDVRKGEPRTPYYLRLTDSKVFSMAGIWESREYAEGIELITFTIITTEPNEEVSKIHDRMPVILEQEEEKLWLDPKADPEALKKLLDAFPAKSMESFPLSTKVNDPSNDDPSVLKPLE